MNRARLIANLAVHEMTFGATLNSKHRMLESGQLDEGDNLVTYGLSRTLARTALTVMGRPQKRHTGVALYRQSLALLSLFSPVTAAITMHNRGRGTKGYLPEQGARMLAR